MKRGTILIIFIIILKGSSVSGNSYSDTGFNQVFLNKHDTLWGNQTLFNGRVWQNSFYMVKEDQFLFSKEFLPGSVTMRGKTFLNVGIMYDIYKDEILTPFYPGGILQLNKEMVDSFSVLFQDKTYRFVRMTEDSLKGFRGYINVIYKGKTALYVKYVKKIDKLAVEGKFDKFYQFSRLYLVKDQIVYQITRKNDLIKALIENKDLIKNFIRKNKFEFSMDNPESYIPVVRYFDSIKQ